MTVFRTSIQRCVTPGSSSGGMSGQLQNIPLRRYPKNPLELLKIDSQHAGE